MLKNNILKIYNKGYLPNLDQYNELIKKCAGEYEMSAVVFLYDNMKLNGIKPNKETFENLVVC